MKGNHSTAKCVPKSKKLQYWSTDDQELLSTLNKEPGLGGHGDQLPCLAMSVNYADRGLRVFPSGGGI
jgi:hypothetical protein